MTPAVTLPDGTSVPLNRDRKRRYVTLVDGQVARSSSTRGGGLSQWRSECRRHPGGRLWLVDAATGNVIRPLEAVAS